jgi:hypothetical protein
LYFGMIFSDHVYFIAKFKLKIKYICDFRTLDIS